jgi:GT2 family glycosyltransferase
MILLSFLHLPHGKKRLQMAESPMIELVALLACHNRREKTLACLEALGAQNLPDWVRISIVLVDDGSTDGTGDAVAAAFPNATILRGDGSLYWCGGMRMAWKEARRMNPHGYLLLNDDTLMDTDAVAALLAMAPCPDSRVIGVASIRHPGGEHATYGGIQRRGGLIAPTGGVERCDTFNANLVLVPQAVCREIGMFHEVYTHGMGDFDYGFEAGRRGIPVLASARFLGQCPRNCNEGTWRDSSLPRSQRWRKLRGPKGLPFREWLIYNRRNSGWLWPWRSISPYLRVLAGL